MESKTLAKRTPRACERCRQTRRRCEAPPHPCPACVAVGVRCEVRVKPRPKRTSARLRVALSSIVDDGHDATTVAVTVLETTSPVQPPSTEPFHRRPTNKVDDTFEQVRDLVKRVLKDECDYDLECQLLEPQLSGPQNTTRPQSLTYSEVSHALDCEHIEELLTAFERFNGADLIDPGELLTTATLILALVDASPKTDHLVDLVTTHDLPLDAVTVFFSALTLGAMLSGKYEYGRFCFGISTALTERFVGPPSFNLCLAYYLQHWYILQTGTSTHARAIIAQTIQSCHDLALQHASYGVRGLYLYLLVYMADQYSSLTYSTAPSIQASSLSPRAFEALATARPYLKSFINLVSVNGHIIEHCHQHANSSTTNPAPSEVTKLEAMIGAVQTGRQAASSDRWPHKKFADICEPIARVHMLCYRIQLRAPGLSRPEDWVSSISIIVHAAIGVLSTYFQLYLPALRTLARQSADKTIPTAGAYLLPPTWRQVKRIMLCVLIITLAYWRGELPCNEASRYLAMARLSLEYPRSKWGSQLQQALLVVNDISHVAGICLQDDMRRLLPADDPDFPAPIEHKNTRRCVAAGQAARDCEVTWNMSCSDEVPRYDASHDAAEWHDSMRNSAGIAASFDFGSDINSLSLWQLTEGIAEDISISFI